jgi:hypothetical protein
MSIQHKVCGQPLVPPAAVSLTDGSERADIGDNVLATAETHSGRGRTGSQG